MAVTSLSDTLATQLANPILDTTDAWRTLILDHKTYLINTGEYINISKEILAQCNYNLDRFLRQESRDPSIKWIVLVLNDLLSDVDFNMDMLSDGIWLPDIDAVNELYTNYLAATAMGTQIQTA